LPSLLSLPSFFSYFLFFFLFFFNALRCLCFRIFAMCHLRLFLAIYFFRLFLCFAFILALTWYFLHLQQYFFVAISFLLIYPLFVFTFPPFAIYGVRVCFNFVPLGSIMPVTINLSIVLCTPIPPPYCLTSTCSYQPHFLCHLLSNPLLIIFLWGKPFIDLPHGILT